MDTRAIGDVAEAAVLHALTAAGLPVLVPFGRFGPYDLAVDTPRGFVRVQVKNGRVRDGCVRFNTRSTDHGRGKSDYEGRADVFGVHVQETGEQYIVPVAGLKTAVAYLRIVPSANNQRRGIRLAADFLLADGAREALTPAP